MRVRDIALFILLFAVALPLGGTPVCVAQVKPRIILRTEWALSSWSSTTVHEWLDRTWSLDSRYSSVLEDPEVKLRLDKTVRAVLDTPFAFAPCHPLSHVVIHHTASSPPPSGDWAETVQSIWFEHTFLRDWDSHSRFGWGDIGYHYLIAPDGTIYQGRDAGDDVQPGSLSVRQGAHAGSCGNVGTLGVAFLGNFTSRAPSTAAIGAAADLIAWYFRRAGITNASENVHLCGVPMERILTHGDLTPDKQEYEGPGSPLSGKLTELREAVQERLGTTMAGEYLNPLQETDVLELREDGTCYLEVFGLGVGLTGKWVPRGDILTLEFPDGTTLRGHQEEQAIVLEGASFMPVAWVATGRPIPVPSDAIGTYRQDRTGETSIELLENGTYAKREGNSVVETGKWELEGNRLTLTSEGGWGFPEVGVLLEDRLYFVGLFGAAIWVRE